MHIRRKNAKTHVYLTATALRIGMIFILRARFIRSMVMIATRPMLMMMIMPMITMRSVYVS